MLLFVPPQAPIKSAEPALTLEEADAQVERLALAPAATEAPVSDTPKPQAAAEPASGNRNPRPLLHCCQLAGLTRVEAIAAQRKSLSQLPAYAELTKREAI